jgi:trans-aconitate methyltransferase
LATSGANAAAKIRQRQSSRSSSSRFSAASLRGLTGHQTAAARLMPNTQPKATGSLPDRIATLSPGAMPDRASARPTDQDSRRTSS